LEFTPDTWATYDTYEKTKFKPLEFKADTWKSYQDLYEPVKYKTKQWVPKTWSTVIYRPSSGYLTGYTPTGTDSVRAKDMKARITKESYGGLPGMISTIGEPGIDSGIDGETIIVGGEPDGLQYFSGGGRKRKDDFMLDLILGGGSRRKSKMSDIEYQSSNISSKKQSSKKSDGLSFLGGSFRSGEDKNRFLDYQNLKLEPLSASYKPMSESYVSPAYEPMSDVLFGAPGQSVLESQNIKETGIGQNLIRSDQPIKPFVQENTNETFFGTYTSPGYKSIRDVVSTTGIRKRMFGTPKKKPSVGNKTEPGVIV
jgi:hypothetical protein